jgi:hypothetical protein
VAGHPDDQQVGIEFLGARLGEGPGRPPLADRLYDRWRSRPAGVRRIFEGAAFGARPALDDLGPLERAHAVGDDKREIPRRPRWSSLKPLGRPSISRTIRSVQRSPRISVALATGQYLQAVLRVARPGFRWPTIDGCAARAGACRSWTAPSPARIIVIAQDVRRHRIAGRGRFFVSVTPGAR